MIRLKRDEVSIAMANYKTGAVAVYRNTFDNSSPLSSQIPD
jgi:hypothetical protein